MPSFCQTGPRRSTVYDSSVFSCGMLRRERDRADRARLNAGLHAAGAALGAQMRSVGAEVALLRPPDRRIELHTGRDERARADAHLAADAQVLVDHPHVAELRVRLVRPHRLAPDRPRRRARPALVALRHVDVVRPVRERILLDLDARQGVRGASPVCASEHIIMQVPHPWHFFMSTSRNPSAFGMTRTFAAKIQSGRSAAAAPIAPVPRRKRRLAASLGVAVAVPARSRPRTPSARVFGSARRPASSSMCQLLEALTGCDLPRRRTADPWHMPIRTSMGLGITAHQRRAPNLGERALRTDSSAVAASSGPMRFGCMGRCRARLREPSPKPSPTSEASTSDRPWPAARHRLPCACMATLSLGLWRCREVRVAWTTPRAIRRPGRSPVGLTQTGPKSPQTCRICRIQTRHVTNRCPPMCSDR